MMLLISCSSEFFSKVYIPNGHLKSFSISTYPKLTKVYESPELPVLPSKYHLHIHLSLSMLWTRRSNKLLSIIKLNYQQQVFHWSPRIHSWPSLSHSTQEPETLFLKPKNDLGAKWVVKYILYCFQIRL